VNQGSFVDCYYIDIPQEVTLDNYIKAFYTTSLFKIERTILSIATFKQAIDMHAVELSRGTSENYSVWTVESRVSNQIMLRDFTGKTRSWLMVQKSKVNEETFTRLYFGSVVMPKAVSKNGQAKFGLLFHVFGKFHQLYSRALLNAAYNQLLSKNNNDRLRLLNPWG
jgi:hypothetical protein